MLVGSLSKKVAALAVQICDAIRPCCGKKCGLLAKALQENLLTAPCQTASAFDTLVKSFYFIREEDARTLWWRPPLNPAPDFLKDSFPQFPINIS
jgi:hypothetical protein